MSDFKPHRVGDYIILTGSSKEFWRMLAMAFTGIKTETEKKSLNGKYVEYSKGRKALVTYQDGGLYVVQKTNKVIGKVYLAPYKGVIPK